MLFVFVNDCGIQIFEDTLSASEEITALRLKLHNQEEKNRELEQEVSRLREFRTESQTLKNQNETFQEEIDNCHKELQA
ncbi:MAG: hypothetical protein LIP10_06375 [Clostridiales bacterium]|nr:hypothetical protein [Clostridiales bacterium]